MDSLGNLERLFLLKNWFLMLVCIHVDIHYTYLLSTLKQYYLPMYVQYVVNIDIQSGSTELF